MRRAPFACISVSSVALALPSLALAHPGPGHGFMAGLAHPIGGLDHLLAMIAVGLLAGRAGGTALWKIPASFMLMMAVGTLIGLAALSLPLIETGIALSIVVFGLMLAANHNPTLPLTALAVAFFALFHGHAHGAEAAEDVSGFAYVAGMLSMSAALHACGATAAILLTRTPGVATLRVGGGMLALAGLGISTGLL